MLRLSQKNVLAVSTVTLMVGYLLWVMTSDNAKRTLWMLSNNDPIKTELVDKNLVRVDTLTKEELDREIVLINTRVRKCTDAYWWRCRQRHNVANLYDTIDLSRSLSLWLSINSKIWFTEHKVWWKEKKVKSIITTTVWEYIEMWIESDGDLVGLTRQYVIND